MFGSGERGRRDETRGPAAALALCFTAAFGARPAPGATLTVGEAIQQLPSLLSFESGKTGWGEVLVFRRELVEARRDYVDTLAEARLAAIELDFAASLGD